ncbi:hypothetical protein GCM10011331_12570 [Flavimobilis marinus]|nr:hypothetical protein GCM10011331_12570 [Flavimobilis marinus]
MLVVARPTGHLEPAEVAAALAARRVVAAVQEGTVYARPGTVAVHVGIERGARSAGTARVALDDHGTPSPGPTRHELAGLLAADLQADVTVGGRLVVGPDGRQRRAPRDGGREPAACRTIYAWRADQYATHTLLPLATRLGVPVSHVETAGWIVAWPTEPTATLEPRPGFGRSHEPWFIGWRMGDEHGLVAKRPGERRFVAAASPSMRPVGSMAHTEASHLAALLAEPARWNGAEPGVRAASLREHGPAIPPALDDAALDDPARLLPAASRHLGLPRVALEVLDGAAPQDVAQTVPARRGQVGAAAAGIAAVMLDRPRGTGPLAQLRLLFWEVPLLRLALGTAVLLLGAMLVANQRTGQVTFGALEWAMAVLFVVYGTGTIVTGTALLVRRRRRTRN